MFFVRMSVVVRWSLLITVAGSNFAVNVFGVTKEDIRDIISANTFWPDTGVVNYNKEMVNYEPLNDSDFVNKPEGTKTVSEINKRLHLKYHLVFDENNVKLNTVDLRDVNKLFNAQTNLPEWQKLNISQTQTQIMQGDYSLIYKEMAKNVDVHLLPRAVNKPANEFLEFGFVRSMWLQAVDDRGITLEELMINGQPMVKIITNRTMDDKPWQMSVIIDPSIGYRYHHVTIDYDGITIKEMDAGDYKTFSGIILPMKSVIKKYSLDGKELLESTTLTIEEVNFDIEIDKGEFELEVPAGTRITDAILEIDGFTERVTVDTETVSINSVIDEAVLKIADEQLDSMASEVSGDAIKKNYQNLVVKKTPESKGVLTDKTLEGESPQKTKSHQNRAIVLGTQEKQKGLRHWFEIGGALVIILAGIWFLSRKKRKI